MTTDNSGMRFLHPTDPRKRRRRLYGSTAWERVRSTVLKRDNYTCQWCGKEGATIGDHLEDPIEHPEHALDARYVVASCRSCNARRGRPGYGEQQPKRDPMTAPSAYASRPAPIESPRILPPGGSVRPDAADTARRITWAMALPEVGGEPTDHEHRRWAAPIEVHHERQVWRACPASCLRVPVRWRRIG